MRTFVGKVHDYAFNAFEDLREDTSASYEQRIVMFIDILGFESLIESTVNDGIEKPVELEKLFLCFNKALEEIYDIANRDYIQFSHFSDSFVISHIIFDNDDDSMFQGYLMILLIARTIIRSFLKNNILVRGGVAQGNVYHREGYLLFGPALNEAYYLESKVAKYPRIIFSEEIVNSIERKLGVLPSKTLKQMNVPLERDTDNQVYLNYFTGQYLDECTKRLLDNFPTDTPSLLEKFNWIKEKYGNRYKIKE